MMKIIKLCLVTMIIYSCFPSFEPKTKIIKEIKQENSTIKWIDVVGTLDQDFPDYIIVEKNNIKDTICKAHNIVGLKLNNDTIIISFDGQPKEYSTPIGIKENTLGYKVKVNIK